MFKGGINSCRKMVPLKIGRRKEKILKVRVAAGKKPTKTTPDNSFDDMTGCMPNLDLKGFRHEHRKER